MIKYVIMEEFLAEDFVGCFGMGDRLVDEGYIRKLVDKSDSVKMDYDEEELIVKCGNEVKVISYV